MTSDAPAPGFVTLAAHVAASITVPAALIVAAGLVWMWIRVGRQDLPKTIRVLRRTTIALSLLALPGLVRGLSFVNPSQTNQQLQYVLTWTGVMVMVLLILLVACIDLLLVGKLERAKAIGEMADLRWQVIEHAQEEELHRRRTGSDEEGDGSDVSERPEGGPIGDAASEKRPDDANRDS